MSDGQTTAKRFVGRAVREMLALLIWVGTTPYWLLYRAARLALAAPTWLLVGYTRFRHGKEAAETVRRALEEATPPS